MKRSSFPARQSPTEQAPVVLFGGLVPVELAAEREATLRGSLAILAGRIRDGGASTGDDREALLALAHFVLLANERITSIDIATGGTSPPIGIVEDLVALAFRRDVDVGAFSVEIDAGCVRRTPRPFALIVDADASVGWPT